MQETNIENREKYAGLSNKELVCIYHRFNEFKKKTDMQLSRGAVTKEMMSPIGPVNVLHSITQEEADEIKNSEFYKLIQAIPEKLAPLVELIQECDPEIKEFLDQIK